MRSGNHLQLINLLIGSLKRAAKATNEIKALQETVDRAAEFAGAFLHYSQTSTSMSPVKLGDILRTLIDSNSPLFEERQVTFKD
jgi:hypothetical protein